MTEKNIVEGGQNPNCRKALLKDVLLFLMHDFWAKLSSLTSHFLWNTSFSWPHAAEWSTWPLCCVWPCTHNITHTFRCGASHNPLTPACSPGRSWYPYHAQLWQSRLDSSLEDGGLGQRGGKRRRKGKKKKNTIFMKTLPLYPKSLTVYSWKPK